CEDWVMSQHYVVSSIVAKEYSYVVVVIFLPTCAVIESSSVISRARACSGVSPDSILPPGNSQYPAREVPGALRQARTLLSRQKTAATTRMMLLIPSLWTTVLGRTTALVLDLKRYSAAENDIRKWGGIARADDQLGIVKLRFELFVGDGRNRGIGKLAGFLHNRDKLLRAFCRDGRAFYYQLCHDGA